MGLLVSTPFDARPATESWNPGGAGGGNGTWDAGITADWNAGQTWLNGSDALFSGAGGTVTVLGPVANSLTFSASGAYLLQSGTLTLTGSNVTVNSDTTIASGISSTVGLAVTGTGSLTLTGSASLGSNNLTVDIGSFNIVNSGAVSDSYGYIGDNAGTSGAVTVSGNGASWVNNSFLYVGNSGAGALTIANGGLVATDISGLFGTDIGTLAGSSGTVTVTGSGSMWSNNGDVYVGNSGTGTAVVSNGGTVTDSFCTIGASAGSTGSVTVTGTGSTWTNTGIFYVGESGTGALLVSNGGAITAQGSLIGNNAGSSGMATVTGPGSTLTAVNDLYIGESGTGSLLVSNGGVVSVSGGHTFNDGFIGDNAGSSGTVTVTGTGSSWTSSGALYVGNSGTGTLVITSHGGGTDGFIGYIGYAAGSNGTVTVSGSGSTWTSAAHISVGESGTGTLAISNGGVVSTGTGGSFIGNIAGSNGTVSVTGTGSAWTNNTASGALYIGNAGAGTLAIASGGSVTDGGAGFIGDAVGSSGIVTVTGTGSKWTSGGDLFVGGNASGAGGAGFLGIDNAGMVAAAQTIVWTSGTLSLGESVLLNTPLTVNGGTVTLVDGQLQSVKLTDPVTIGAGSNLDFELGNGSDSIALSGAGSWTVTGPSFINLYGLSGQVTSGTDVLISATSGKLSLGNVYNGGNFTYSLLNTATSSDVVITAAAPLTTAYWTGTQSNVWSVLVGGTASNWATDQAGTNDPGLTPSATTNVIFSASGATGESNTLLGADMTIQSLTVSDTSAVVISGYEANPLLGTDTLTISGSNGTNGITITSGAGPVTIAANVYLSGSSQGVTVNNAAGLLLSGSIGGSNGISESGSGTLTLTGVGSFGGAPVVVESGNVAIQNGGDLSGGNGMIGSGGLVTVSGSGSTWTSAGGLVVGDSGTGTLLIANGGVVVSGSGSIGAVAGTGGLVTVTGSGSSWVINGGNLNVGQSGSGALLIANGGSVTASQATIGNGGILALGEGVTFNSGLTISGGIVTLMDGQLQTVTLTNPVVINAGSTLDFDVGNGSDQIAFSGAGSLAVTATSTINLYVIPGAVPPGSDVLIGAATNGKLSLGNVYNTGNYTYSLLSTSTSENLIVTATTPLTTAYWKGGHGNLWDILAGNAATNWTTDQAGAQDPRLTPSATTDVIFSANGSASQGNTLLGANTTINSLTFSTSGATVISGSDPNFPSQTDTLTISDNTGNNAITVNTGAGMATIAANLYLSGESQNITVNNTAGLLVTGSFGGSNGFVEYGTGTMSLTSVDNFGGGTVDVESASLMINAGGKVYSGNDFIDAGGTVTVSGSGSVWAANSGIQIGNSGAGTLLITGGGAFSVSNATATIGNIAGSAGSVTVSGTGSLWTANNIDVYVGQSGTGTLVITNGGAVTGNYFSYVGLNPGSNGMVTVSGPGSTWTNGYLYVGQSGTGTLLITNGGAVLSNNPGFIADVGSNPGSNGTVTVSGTGSTWTTGTLFIGDSGTGTLLIDNGGVVTMPSGNEACIGNTPGSIGLVAVSGSGSAWSNGADLYVGGNVGGAGGSGVLSIGSGGIVSAPLITIWTTGTLAFGENPNLNSPLSVSGGSISLVDGQLQTVTFTTPVAISAGSNLNFEVGNGSDQIALSASGSLAVTGTAAVNLYGLSGMVTSGTDVLITATAANLVIGNVYNSGNFTYSLLSTATSKDLVVTAATPLTTAYWAGGYNGIWSVLVGGSTSNWTTDAAGTTDPHLTPSATTSVIFSGSNAANEGSTLLGTSMTIKSLTMSDTNAVVISGADPNPLLGADTLTISGSGGITDTPGAGMLNISANVALGANQTWTNNSTNRIAVSGTVGGPFGLTKAGTGTLMLSGNDTYTGATTLTGGTLIVSGSLAGTSSVSVASGATLRVNGLLGTGATVSGSLAGTGLVEAVTLNSGGVIMPGFRPGLTTSGTLTADGNVTMAGTSTFSIRLGVSTAADNDQLLVTNGGIISLNRATLSLTIGSLVNNPSSLGLEYIIINGGAGGTGTGGDVFAQTSPFTTSTGYKFNILYASDASGDGFGTGSDVVLQLVAIPEPATCAMLLGGLAALALFRRCIRRPSNLSCPLTRGPLLS